VNKLEAIVTVYKEEILQAEKEEATQAGVSTTTSASVEAPTTATCHTPIRQGHARTKSIINTLDTTTAADNTSLIVRERISYAKNIRTWLRIDDI
jgi:hypothetical protein